MVHVGEHAVVLGAGMGGLVAARVLADHFSRVTIVERDSDDGSGTRRGIPQGIHPHGFLTERLYQIFERLFPGLRKDYLADGAVEVDLLGQFRLYVHGRRLRQPRVGPSGVWASRPLLERRLRERVCALPQVSLRDGCEATGPIATGTRVVGVRLALRGIPCPELLLADLVVDATGRSARSSVWLRALGYAAPPEQRVRVDLGYATQVLRLPADALEDRAVMVHPWKDRPYGVAFAVREGGCWSLTLFGHGRTGPRPTDVPVGTRRWLCSPRTPPPWRRVLHP